MSFFPESRGMFLLAVFASYIIQAAIDSAIHQIILSFALLICRESITLRVRVFMTGIVILCLAFGGLDGLKVLRASFMAEKFLLTRAGTLMTFFTLLFAFTSQEYVPLFASLLTLALFMAVNVSIRRSVRGFMEVSE